MGDGDRRTNVEAPSFRSPKTTIVGGQPPGNERGLGGVPVGVEELLSMAAVDPEFARALVARLEETIQASGVALTGSERAILSSVGPGNLETMIDGVRGVMPDEQRREFLGRSAAAVFLLASGASLAGGAAGCDSWGGKVTGSRPEPPQPVEHKYPAPTGARPDPPPEPPAKRHPGIETGIRPDLLEKPDQGVKPDQSVKRPQPTRGIRPDRPQHTKGIRPDRPLSRGISPDRTRPMPKSRGISPDLPDDDINDPFK